MQLKSILLITLLPVALAARCESGGTHNAGGNCHGHTDEEACQTSNNRVVVSTLFTYHRRDDT